MSYIYHVCNYCPLLLLLLLVSVVRCFACPYYHILMSTNNHDTQSLLYIYIYIYFISSVYIGTKIRKRRKCREFQRLVDAKN